MRRAAAAMLAAGILAAAFAAPASAKTKTATFTRCYPVAAGFVIDRGTLGLDMPIKVPKLGPKKKVQPGIVTNITASVRITHTSDSDVLLSLVSPAGRVIALSSGRGGAGDGFGAASTGCDGSLVTFADSAAGTITAPGNTGDNPIVGAFRPEQPLSTFVGGQANGVWTLVTTDRTSNLLTGAVTAFGMTVTYRYKTAKTPKK